MIDAVKQIIDALVDLAEGVIVVGIDPLPPGTTPNITALKPQITASINTLNTLRGQLQPGRMNLIADVDQAAVALRNLLQIVPAGTGITFTWVDAVAAAPGLPGLLSPRRCSTSSPSTTSDSGMPSTEMRRAPRTSSTR